MCQRSIKIEVQYSTVSEVNQDRGTVQCQRSIKIEVQYSTVSEVNQDKIEVQYSVRGQSR